MPYFKALNSNGSSPFGVTDIFIGKLPNGDEPGPWVEVAGDLAVDINAKNKDCGIFLCKDEGELVAWLADALFEIEPDPDAPFLEKDGYTVAKRARLIRRLYADVWNDETGRRFATDCAEHVLDLIPDGQEKKIVVAAIAKARELAASHNNEAQDQLESACSRAEEASISLEKMSTGAARAAKAAAEAAKGYVSGPSAARQASQCARHARAPSKKDELQWQVTCFKEYVSKS